MSINEQDLKKIAEISYLNQDNTWRYRAILTYCYQKHERMQTYIYPEEIYHHLHEDEHFKEYSFEQLEQDLAQLVDWNNLTPQQETSKAKTIEDFKRKKLRYQCTPYTVEIERMIKTLKKIGQEFGGSLETTQFDRLLQSLTTLLEKGRILDLPELNQTWLDLYNYFHSLVQNASDYLAHLKSAKVEDRMKTSEFIIYKDKFTHYLQSFMIGLQQSSVRIEGIFKSTDPNKESIVLERLAKYQTEIPRLGEEKTLEEYKEDYHEQYLSIKQWFLGTAYRESELHVLYLETMETIRRITRFAQRLAEQHQVFRSRKSDYLYLAKWFSKLAQLQEAAKLSAVLFGATKPRHFFAQPRVSDSSDISAEDEAPAVIEMKPRTNKYREKTQQGIIKEHRTQKAHILREYKKQQLAHDALIDALIKNEYINLSDLPIISSAVRKTLLGWITRCMQQKDRKIQTQTGRIVTLLWQKNNSVIKLKSQDGDFMLPAMKLKVTAAKVKTSE